MTGLLDSLAVCLRKGGCIVVPGLVPDQYYLTLGTTVAGGLVFGATSRIEPQGGRGGGRWLGRGVGACLPALSCC